MSERERIRLEASARSETATSIARGAGMDGRKTMEYVRSQSQKPAPAAWRDMMRDAAAQERKQ